MFTGYHLGTANQSGQLPPWSQVTVEKCGAHTSGFLKTIKDIGHWYKRPQADKCFGGHPGTSSATPNSHVRLDTVSHLSLLEHAYLRQEHSLLTDAANNLDSTAGARV